MKITLKDEKERHGIACLPLVKNIPEPKNKDWRKVKCPVCGESCWESALARQVIAGGTVAVCTLCALKA